MMAEEVTIGNCRLVLGDCREVLPLLPPCDLIFTSPPYNMNLRIRGGEYCSRQIVDEFSTKYEGYADNLPIDDYEALLRETIAMSLNVSPLVFWNIQFLTGNKRPMFRLIGEYADSIKEFIVWDKMVAQPAMSDGVMNSRWEAILVFDRENGITRRFDAAFKRGALDNLWQIGKERSAYDSHGATFPLSLPSKAIDAFTFNGQTVCDPFLGTGTTGVACINLGRKFIGIEFERKYFDIACERISRALAQPRLFDDAKLGAGGTAVQADFINA
jgi:site-specific DNA-methyltransferase (adenine-specific)/modification methylase